MSQIIRFDKIVPEGKAMGHLKDGRAVFTIGPLPGEVAEVGIRRQKKTYAEAVLRRIIEPSTHRSATAEDHALSCSPWQAVDPNYQVGLRRSMLQEAYQQQHLEVALKDFVEAPTQLSYRNRLDFTVARIDGRLQLAFHQRGSWDTLIPLPHGCKLGSESMNRAALDLASQLDKLGINPEPAMITVRHARTTGQLLTILTTEANADWQQIKTDDLDNFIVARPLPGSGAPGKCVYTSKDPAITEVLAGTTVQYPYNAFFQTNTTVFEKALEQIINEAGGAQHIVELYSGVGAIGLPLAARGKVVRGIEIVPEAVEFAERNAREAGIRSYQAQAVAAEKMDATILEGADCIILDPPRAGLHRRVTDWLLAAAAERIIYLSCNPVTQARDVALLSSKYQIEALTGFDFYPGTLHLESLISLRRM